MGELMTNGVTITELPNGGDHRGVSFSVSPGHLSFLGRVADIHVASVQPGAVRGNHFHLRRREILIVTHESAWKFHWDEGENTPAQVREFSGSGTEVILIEPYCSHAVLNSGDRTLMLTGLSSETYDPEESVRRVMA
jgi:dTDP-4-dehydrorhamnose 3,5-epimerase-like enzyme